MNLNTDLYDIVFCSLQKWLVWVVANVMCSPPGGVSDCVGAEEYVPRYVVIQTVTIKIMGHCVHTTYLE